MLLFLSSILILLSSVCCWEKLGNSVDNEQARPEARQGALLVHVRRTGAKRGVLVLYGGKSTESGVLLDDTWLFDLATDTWRDVSGTSADAERPPARFSLVGGAHGVTVVITSGEGKTTDGRVFYNDAWLFDLIELEWRRLRDGPVSYVWGGGGDRRSIDNCLFFVPRPHSPSST